MSEVNEKLQEMNPVDVSNIYKRIFDTPDGKLMLEDLRNRCYVKVSSYHHQTNSNDVLFNEGMRAVVLHIESQINFTPEAEDALAEGRE